MQVAKQFVEDIRGYFTEKNAIKRDYACELALIAPPPHATRIMTAARKPDDEDQNRSEK